MSSIGSSGEGEVADQIDELAPAPPEVDAGAAVDVEVRAMGRDPLRQALIGLDRAGEVRYPMRAVAVPAARVAEMVPLLQGTGLDLVAVHGEPLDDVGRTVRRSLASGADEIEVPWSALPATVDALGFDTPITCDLTSIEPSKRAAVAHLAFGRGARLLRCSLEDLGRLAAIDRLHEHQRIKVDATGYDITSVIGLLTGHGFGHPTRMSIPA